jgi:Histidine kinase-, DNA gyrase B-, and HSP90-like ATPase
LLSIIAEIEELCGVRGVTYTSGHEAVVGVSENHTPQAGSGVFGQSDGTDVWGTSKTWMGVYGNSESTTGGAGVMGEAVEPGVIGKSQTWMGVYGETITLAAQATSTALEICVSSSGIKTPAAERDRIFDKFYRIPNNDPWKHGGTGLGLTLVKKMAERLGASIYVDGCGKTTLTLKFLSSV